MTFRRGAWILTATAAVAIPLGAAHAYRAGCSVAPLVKSELAREIRPGVSPGESAALAAANAQFALDVQRELAATRPAENIVWSPHSTSVALAMLYAGAGGATASEVRAAMHWTLPAERLHPAFDSLDQRLASHVRGPVTLRVADSLWGSPSLPFERTFLDTLARQYGEGVRLTDFAADPAGSRRRINRWVSEATDGKVRELLGPGSLPPETGFAIVEAVAFAADWVTPFEPERTSGEPFTLVDGTAREVATMRSGPSSIKRSSQPGLDAVELPYAGGELVLDIVMPKSPLAAFESELGPERLGACLGDLREGPTRLSLPRFGLSGATFSLRAVLEKLGIQHAFDPASADFSPMARGGVVLREVLHQAMIAVDERGTEAAAATAELGGTTGAPPPDDEIAITIDHPFVFAVRDLATGAILFMGHVVDPTQSGSR